MTYILSPGHRVTWCHDFTEVKAQVTRIWKDKAEILTADFQKLKVPLDELELVPVVKSVREQEICTLTDPVSVREQEICTLTDHHWIEEKMIKRSGKLHGPYRYERWRDQQTGKMKSKYLGKRKMNKSLTNQVKMTLNKDGENYSLEINLNVDIHFPQ